MKRWHGFVVAVAVVAIVAYLAMIVGPRYYDKLHANSSPGGNALRRSATAERGIAVGAGVNRLEDAESAKTRPTAPDGIALRLAASARRSVTCAAPTRQAWVAVANTPGPSSSSLSSWLQCLGAQTRGSSASNASFVSTHMRPIDMRKTGVSFFAIERGSGRA